MARAAERGLTLVEMLVVLAIVAVAAGAVSLGFGAGGGRVAEVEARRLAARLDYAADDAMITDRRLALVADGNGYRFVAWDGARWTPAVTPTLAPHQLAGGATLDGLAAGPQPLDGPVPPIRLAAPGAAPWAVRFDGAAAEAAPA